MKNRNSDPLEQYIREHRSDFDCEQPRADLWGAISRDLDERSQAAPARGRVVSMWANYLRIAASVLLILFAGAAGGYYLNEAQQPDDTIASIEDVLPEYREMEQYFEGETQKQMAKLAAYQPDQVIVQDLEQLDQTMEELRRELQDAPKGTEAQIVESLIETYQIKLSILERVLERMQATQPQIDQAETTDEDITI